METKPFIILIRICFLTIVSVIFFEPTLAQKNNIQYPIAELRNCQNEKDCRIYCDKPENVTACLDFAQKNNLMSEKEIEMAEKFLAAGGKGPGSCTDAKSCEEYCDDISHIDECISFTEENNLIPAEELEEAKKVQAAIRRGIKPPPCKNKKACDLYCDDPNHMEECITFAEAAGFLHSQELEDAKKMLAAIKKGVTPPPCRGKEACEEYCTRPENMEVCLNFAIEAGFMPEKEKADAQKMLEAIKKGVKPPNCKGKEECDLYCSQKEHFEECLKFAEAAGLTAPEEVEMARKTGGKGPGGCKSKEECEVFCRDPANQEICFNFGKEHGLIPEEELRKMEEGRQKLQQALSQAPPEVLDCLKSLLGEETVEKLKSGAEMPSEEIGEKMRECFEKMGPLPESKPGMMPPPWGQEQTIPPSGQRGPGGCQTPKECKTYCQTHPEECANFQPPPGFQPPEGTHLPPPGTETSPPEAQPPRPSTLIESLFGSVINFFLRLLKP
jgi:hypothetical protein